MQNKIQKLIFILAIFLIMPSFARAGVIATENYDALADWHCTVGGGGPGISGTIWADQSLCTNRTYNSVNHYGGEISSPGRGGTGKSLKQWRAAGTYESDYDGYLDNIFNSTLYANHYRTIYTRWYVKIPSELNATGCTGECPKFGGRVYGGTTVGEKSSQYQIVLDLGDTSIMQDAYFKIFNVNASAPYDNVYSMHPASYYNLFDGNWHSVEVGVVLGTNGQANGEEHIYIDGTEIDLCRWERNCSAGSKGVTNISHNWPSNAYFTYPFVPGVGNLTVTGTAQWTVSDSAWHAIEWDDYVVSTSYIGLDNGDGGDTTAPSAPTGLGVI